MDKNDVFAARKIIADYENDQDRPPDRDLKRRISGTKRILEQYVEEEPDVQ